MNSKFPEFRKSIENLIEDEEGNIPGKKLLMLGTMMIVLGNLLSIDAFAAHDLIVHIDLIVHTRQEVVIMRVM